MRFLADAGISPVTVDFLIQLGHDAVHVRTLDMQSAPDADVIALAHTESRIVLTFDLDFGDVLAHGVFDKPSVVIFRLTNQRPQSVNLRLEAIVRERATELESGTLILVEDARYRLRRLPIGQPTRP